MGVETEVVVIGGGPAGAAAATTLARAGRSVLLIERGADRAFKVGEGLPPAAAPLLRQLGVAERFAADGHLPSYGNVSAWGSEALQSTDFIRNPYGHGWHLDRARFDASLRVAARESGASLIEGASVTEAIRSGGEWQIRLANRDERRVARWIIDSTGRSRWLARRLGVPRSEEDRLLGFVALFRAAPGDPDRDTLTLIEAVEDGWWYTARLPGDRRVVVYLTDRDTPSARQARTRDGYLRQLDETRHTRERLGAYDVCLNRPPLAAPAASSRLERCVGEGWIAAGDAATAFDPLSSQGILTALYSGLRAGETVDACLRGDGGAAEAFGRQTDALYAAYLRNRVLFYAAEGRWATRPFWSRRHGL
jgi:flavin-dependent dehydrogenase